MSRAELIVHPIGDSRMHVCVHHCAGMRCVDDFERDTSAGAHCDVTERSIAYLCRLCTQTLRFAGGAGFCCSLQVQRQLALPTACHRLPQLFFQIVLPAHGR